MLQLRHTIRAVPTGSIAITKPFTPARPYAAVRSAWRRPPTTESPPKNPRYEVTLRPTPPWQLCDLSAWQQRLCEKYGPDTLLTEMPLNHSQRKIIISNHKHHAVIARNLEAKFGEEWYELLKEGTDEIHRTLDERPELRKSKTLLRIEILEKVAERRRSPKPAGSWLKRLFGI